MTYSDQPAHSDDLGFTPSVATLSRIIKDTTIANTPLTIGIFGAWGSGKTSLMTMLLDKLNTFDCVPVWFEAWRYAQADALWRALLLAVVEELRRYILADADKLGRLAERREKIFAVRTKRSGETTAQLQATLERELDDLVAALYHTVEREELGGVEIDWGEAGKATARTAIRLGLAAIPFVGPVTKALEEAVKAAQGELAKGEEVEAFAKAIRRERAKIYRDQVRSLEQFHQNLRRLIEEWLIEPGFRLVLFIDDLDRCLPEQAVSVLEALKVFLDIPGCLFVLGVDRAVIEHGIRVRYSAFALAGASGAPLPIGERDYLEKIVQVPFELPPLDEQTISNFLRKRLGEFNEQELAATEREPIAALMTAGLQPNPRKLKRTFNSFRLLHELRRERRQPPHPRYLAKLVVIQSSYFPIYEQITRNPRLLISLEQIARNRSGVQADEQLKRMLDEQPRLRHLLDMAPFFERPPGASGGLSEAELRDLIFQSQITRSET